MPDKILDEIIDKHLPYEIDMLRSTYRQLSSVAKIPPGSESREQQVARHALIESFCIHARSLMDFFGNKSNDTTDAIAAEFTDGFATPIDPTKEPLKTLRIKLNKQVFHLTRNRTLLVAVKFDPGKDGTLLLQLFESAIARFNACLKPEFNRFKCNTEPVVLVTNVLQDFATSTDSIVSVTLGPYGSPGQNS